MPQLLVINYHRIVEEHEREALSEDEIFWITRRMFEDQLAEIQKLNIPVVSLGDYMRGNIPEGFSIAITFDDNFLSDYTIAFPLLKQVGFPATFFRIAQWQEEGRLSLAQAREMIAAGFTFGSHGCSHRRLTELPETERRHELSRSRDILQEQLRVPVEMFSLPYGLYTAHVIDAATACGYKLVATTRVNVDDPAKQDVLLHRWSVKRTTSIVEFGGMIRNTDTLRRAVMLSAVKTTARKMLGAKAAEKLNVIRNKRK